MIATPEFDAVLHIVNMQMKRTAILLTQAREQLSAGEGEAHSVAKLMQVSCMVSQSLV
jgi:hypothetical protein